MNTSMTLSMFKLEYKYDTKGSCQKKVKVLNFGHWPNLCDPPPLKLWTPYMKKIIIAEINSFETCLKQNLFKQN